MAVFTPSDITATTVEGALLQLTQILQAEEQAYTLAEGATRQNRVALSVNTDTLLATIAVTLPLTVTTGAGGILSVAAAEYAVDAP